MKNITIKYHDGDDIRRNIQGLLVDKNINFGELESPDQVADGVTEVWVAWCKNGNRVAEIEVEEV